MFFLQSSKCHNSQTVKAGELKFLHNDNHLLCVTCHMLHVMYNMSKKCPHKKSKTINALDTVVQRMSSSFEGVRPPPFLIIENHFMLTPLPPLCHKISCLREKQTFLTKVAITVGAALPLAVAVYVAVTVTVTVAIAISKKKREKIMNNFSLPGS